MIKKIITFPFQLISSICDFVLLILCTMCILVITGADEFFDTF